MADPVTLAEARVHLRLPSNIDSDEQAEITRMISVATEWVESFTNRAWTSGTKVAYFDAFPSSSIRKNLGLFLPFSKISSITSITYYDNDYSQQTVSSSDYRLVNADNRAYVYPAMGGVWPTDVSNEPHHIAVTYAVDGTQNVPSSVKQAVLLIVGSLYEYREDGVIDNAGLALVKAPQAAKDLLSPYRLRIA